MLFLEHGLDAPARAEDVERLREAVVVNESGIHREHTHHQDDISPVKKHVPHLHVDKTHAFAV